MAGETVYLTCHSIERAKLRVRSKSSEYSRKQVQLAYERGLRAEDCTSWERNYMDNQNKGKGCVPVAYNGFCFIFCVYPERNEAVCLTVYPLPPWFGKKKSHYYHKKERIKSPKNYKAPERGRVNACANEIDE